MAQEVRGVVSRAMGKPVSVETITVPGMSVSGQTQAKPETKRWVCDPCGFIYDPEEGDPDGGIDPGTPFADIPDDWMCPICGATKADFRELEPGEFPED